MADPLTDDDDNHPDDWAGYPLRDLHRWLRAHCEHLIRDAEKLCILRERGMTHGDARRRLGLDQDDYRVVNQLLRKGVAAVTLAPSDGDGD
jgi:hypothetical protein